MAHTRRALHLSLGAPTRLGAARCMRAALAVLCAAFVAVAASGCAFRMSVQQGNMLDLDNLDQVREGMTRSQVQFLLGTPLIADPFHADRWDYTYFFREGRRRDITRYWVTIHFENDRVARIETKIAPRNVPTEPVEPADPDPIEAIEDTTEVAVRNR